MKKQFTVVVVDDHPVMRLAIKLLLEGTQFDCVGEASDASDAIELVKNTRPDIVLLDLNLGGDDGIQLMVQLMRGNRDTKFLVLTASNDIVTLKKCLNAGANGFVDKEKEIDEIMHALNAVSKGYMFYPAIESTAAEIDDTYGIKKLSERELTIFKLIAAGYTNKEIAEKLFLSQKTISSHKVNIKRKLNARNDFDLVKISEMHSS